MVSYRKGGLPHTRRATRTSSGYSYSRGKYVSRSGALTTKSPEEQRAEEQAKIKEEQKKQEEEQRKLEQQEQPKDIATTRREFVLSLLRRQGRKVEETPEGIKATKGGKQVLITKEGTIIKAPASATLRSGFVRPQPKEVVVSDVEERQQVRQEFGLAPKPEQPSPLKREIESLFDVRFREKVAAQKQREIGFRESPGFKRAEMLSSYITGGTPGVPAKERGWLGYQAQTLTTGLMTWPLQLGGAVAMAGEKSYLTGYAYSDPTRRGSIKAELIRSGTETKKVYDITTREGQSTYIAAGTFGLFGAVAKYKAGQVGPFKGSQYVKTIVRTSKTPLVRTSQTKVVGKTGTIQSKTKVTSADIRALDTKITVRKAGPLQFRYSRQKLMQKTRYADSPAVTVSKGVAKTGSRTYEVRTVQVGRKVYGTIRGAASTKGDIVFFKGRGRYIRVKQLETPRSPGDVSGKVIRKYKVPVIKEKPAVRGMSFARGTTKKYVDVGQKVSGAKAYSFRALERTAIYKAKGATQTFRYGRDVSKAFYGRARLKLTQYDIAGQQIETVKIGSHRAIKTYTPANIKYALQPKYKPSLREVGILDTKPALQYTVSVTRPPLRTTRATSFSSLTYETYTASRFKPGKIVYLFGKESLRGMGRATAGVMRSKRATVSLLRPKPLVKRGRVTVETGIPRFKPKLMVRSKMGVSGKEIISIIQSQTPKKPFLVPVKTVSVTKTTSLAKTRIDSRARTRVPLRLDTPTIGKTKTRAEAITEISTITDVALKTRITTRTVTKTTTPTGGKGLTPFPILVPPTTPTPPVPIPFKFRTSPYEYFKTGKRKKKKYSSVYNPSLEAAGKRIFGRAPRILTGLELRPVPYARSVGAVKV